MAGNDSDDMDLTMSLEEFVTKFTLPHFVRVKEGFYDIQYSPNSLEISNGELLEIYRVVYPLTVTLEFVRFTSDKPTKQQVSMSTMNDDLRFHVLTRYEKPLVYATIEALIDAWPLLVRCKTDDRNKSMPVHHEGDVLVRPAFRKDDELRLIRKIWNDDKNLLLECKVEGSGRLVRLPSTDGGQFLELTDAKSYTLQELIDIAFVERRLRLDKSCKSKPMSLKGIPRDYTGTLHLNKPLVQVQVSRLQQDEYSTEFVVSDPFLVPIDCGIALSPRDETYVYHPKLISFKTYTLSSLVETSTFKCSSVVRVVSWTEQTGLLQNHLIRPADYLVFYGRRSVSWVLAHRLDRYFLIPITNRGRFVCTGSNSPLRLDQLEKNQLPISVQFFRDPDGPAESETLSLDAIIKDEPCVLACKIFGDRVGIAFHLPLRTRIKVKPVEWRGERLPKDPTRFSTYDDSVEEIPVRMYEEIMEHPRRKVFEEGSMSPEVSNSKGSATVPRRPSSKKPPTPPLLLPKLHPKPPTTDHEYLTSVEAIDGLSQLSLSEELTGDIIYTNSLPMRPSVLRKVSSASRREDWRPPHVTLDRRVGQKETKSSEEKPPIKTDWLPPRVTLGRQEGQQEKKTSYENVTMSSAPTKTSTRGRPPLPPAYENHMIDSAAKGQHSVESKPKKSIDERAIIVIPDDGNIANFTASQMSQFLRQMEVPDDVVGVWHERGITGRDFALMSDDALRKDSLDNAVMRFFRNGSRARQTGLDRL